MLRSWVFIATGAFVFAAMAKDAKFDPPDLNLEGRLHRQYLQLQDPDTPSMAPGWIESYQLQQGENLWGLSQMLYGDGNYWPRVWAQNPHITNPHLIRKGHTLQFIMGSEDETPRFRISEEDDGLELTAATQSGPQIEVPPPEIPPRPVIGLPGSFPEWQSVFKARPDKVGIDDSKMSVKWHWEPDKIPLAAFVQENELDPVGSYMESEKESGLPVPMQYLFVKVKKGAGHPGDKLLIVQDHGTIHKVNDQVEGKIDARLIQIYGDIELSEQVQGKFERSSDRENYDIFRALMLHSIHLSLSNFDLIPGQLEVVTLSKNGPSAAVSAQIIGSMKNEASALYGPGDIIFLNKGSKDGLAVGQIMDVYIDRSIRDQETPVNFSNLPSGALKIVKTSGTCATGVLVTAIDSIQQGDRAQATGGEGPNKAPADLDFSGSDTEPAMPPPETIDDSELQ